MFSHRGTTPPATTPVPPMAAATPAPLAAVVESTLAAAEVGGLRELLEGLKLSDSLPAASAWCREQGVDTLAELREAEMELELVEALALKPGKAKILLKRLQDQ